MIKFVKCKDDVRCCRCYYRKKPCGTKRCTGDHRGYYVQVPNKPKPKAKKVAKFIINCVEGSYWYSTCIGGCRCIMKGLVFRKATAIRRARNFCASIGHECVIER